MHWPLELATLQGGGCAVRSSSCSSWQEYGLRRVAAAAGLCQCQRLDRKLMQSPECPANAPSHPWQLLGTPVHHQPRSQPDAWLILIHGKCKCMAAIVACLSRKHDVTPLPTAWGSSWQSVLQSGQCMAHGSSYAAEIWLWTDTYITSLTALKSKAPGLGQAYGVHERFQPLISVQLAVATCMATMTSTELSGLCLCDLQSQNRAMCNSEKLCVPDKSPKGWRLLNLAPNGGIICIDCNESRGASCPGGGGGGGSYEFLHTSSTLELFLALVSKNLMPNSLARACPLLNGTARLLSSISHLFPTRTCKTLRHSA